MTNTPYTSDYQSLKDELEDTRIRFELITAQYNQIQFELDNCYSDRNRYLELANKLQEQVSRLVYICSTMNTKLSEIPKNNKYL